VRGRILGVFVALNRGGVHLDHLIRMKTLAARPQALSDIKRLREIQRRTS
jgi:hypothetical protein